MKQTARKVKEARRNKRIEIYLPCKFINETGEVCYGETKNISTGGAFILSKEPMSLNAYTSISLFKSKIHAQVVWLNRYGFGVCFISVDPSIRKKINDLIETY